jgi:hypothetical protein
MPIASICQDCKRIYHPGATLGRCPDCSRARASADSARRNSHPRSTIYRTPRWRATSRAVLTAAGWRCADCGRHITELRAHGLTLVADHEIPVLQCPDPYDRSNLTARCSECSGRKDGRRAHPS